MISLTLAEPPPKFRMVLGVYSSLTIVLSNKNRMNQGACNLVNGRLCYKMAHLVVDQNLLDCLCFAAALIEAE